MNTYLSYLTALFFLLACNKSAVTNQSDAFTNNEFFTSKIDAKEKLSNELLKRNSKEKLIDIQSVSYIKSDSSNLAILFYSTNTGRHNILFEKSHAIGENEALKVTSCEGDECVCKVSVTIDNQGKVTVNCSCSYCDLITSQ